MPLADLVGAAQAGTQAGTIGASMNPLQGFVRHMLDAYKQKQEFENKAGLLGIQSAFSTMSDISKEGREQGYQLAKEGREQGYKLAEEGREQTSPKYLAQVDAEQGLADVRAMELKGMLTQEKAANILSKMGLQETMAMKKNNPELWKKLNETATGSVTTAAPFIPSKDDLYKRYNINKVNSR